MIKMLIVDFILLALLGYGVTIFLHYRACENKERRKVQNTDTQADKTLS